MKGFRFLVTSQLLSFPSFFGKIQKYRITRKRDSVWIIYPIIVILWHRHVSFCLSASQHILPFLPLFPPCMISEAISWLHNITHRHTCGPFAIWYACAHTHIHKKPYYHTCMRGPSLFNTYSQTISLFSYCSLWLVMELTHCLIWSVWNHCLTSLVDIGGLRGGRLRDAIYE